MKTKTNQIVRIPFRYVKVDANSTSSVTSTWNEIDIVPTSFGARLSDLSDDYQKYRFVDLKISQFLTNEAVYTSGTPPNSITCSSLHGIATDLNPSSVTATISGFAAAAQLSHYAASRSNRVDIVLRRKELLGQSPVEWFDTTATGTPADEFRFQGTIYYQVYIPTATNASSSVLSHFMVEGTCEFCQPADPADTFTLERRVVRDIERLKAARRVEDERKVVQDQKSDESELASLKRQGTAASVPPQLAAPSVIQDDLVFVVPKTSKSWLR